MTKKERKKNKAIKTHRKELLAKQRKKFIKLICTKCGREVKIHITPGHEEYYKNKKDYVCVICK